MKWMISYISVSALFLILFSWIYSFSIFAIIISLISGLITCGVFSSYFQKIKSYDEGEISYKNIEYRGKHDKFSNFYNKY